MKASPLFSTISTEYVDERDCASYKGVSTKTIILLAITVVFGALTAAFLPQIIGNNNMGALIGALIASGIVGFISVIVGRLNVNASKYCGVIYAACQGLFLGTMTSLFESLVPGVGIIAVASTVVIFTVMLVLFATGIIRYGSFLRKAFITLTISAVLMVIVLSIVGLVYPQMFNNIGLVIGLEAFFLFYGAITLTMNFAEVNQLVSGGFDKKYEWQASLGLMVSILYIYVEALRLAALLLARDN